MLLLHFLCNGVTSACLKHDRKLGLCGIVNAPANEIGKYIRVFLDNFRWYI